MTDYKSDIEKHGRRLKSQNKVQKKREKLRIKVLRETLFCLQSPYLRSEYRKLADANLNFWKDQHKTDDSKMPKKIEVTLEDWGDAALRLTKTLGVRFAVLNMANAYTPGGGYVEGMPAQEENMFRRTDCHFSLPRKETYKPDKTNLLNGKDGSVYLDKKTPRVCIRGSENPKTIDYPFLDNSDIFSFYELRAAAVDYRGDPDAEFDKAEAEKRITAILNTLKSNGVRHVVLSAFGCGAFRGNAEKTAKIFRKLLLGNYVNDFDCVCFAIYYPGYGQDNFVPFNKIFSKTTKYYEINSMLDQRKGLPNIGNSCYMNSVMQCLASTIPLIQYFSTSQYMLDLNCGSNMTTRRVANFLQNMVYSEKTPKNKTCKQLKLSFKPQFHNYNQQDAEELLLSILDQIHTETFYGEAIKFKQTQDNLSCKKYINHQKQNNWSIINDIFTFYLETKLTCTNCNNSWTSSITPFHTLQIKQEFFKTSFLEAVKCFSQRKDKDVTVSTCERCGVQPVRSQFLFCKHHYPSILVISFSRFIFKFDEANGIVSKKNTQKIIFDDSIEFYGKTYNLYAVVNHTGALSTGHYWAYCKSHKSHKWYRYDDDTVTLLKAGKFCTKNAYILFYQRA
tara:strand:- start:192 stop:2048 length:1857 start_codon:yes stop_codon:yes gene_type:complete